jgi:hypothetical protein
MDMEGGRLDNAIFKAYKEIVNAIGSATGAKTIDLTLGNIVTATTTGITTWTVTNPAVSGKCSSFVLILTNGGSAAQTWMSGTKWPGGVAPTLTASGVDVLTFFTIDGGTTWRGVLSETDSK